VIAKVEHHLGELFPRVGFSLLRNGSKCGAGVGNFEDGSDGLRGRNHRRDGHGVGGFGLPRGHRKSQTAQHLRRLRLF